MVLVRYFSHTYLDEELLETMLVEEWVLGQSQSEKKKTTQNPLKKKDTASPPFL